MDTTTIILFGDGNNYLRERQVRKILKDEPNSRALLCEDYDQLDELIPILKENNVQKLVFLHEDKNIDRFEKAVHLEYGHLFEVDVGIDYSKERYLKEGDTRSMAGGGTATKGEYENIPTEIILFPINAPTKGANKAVSAVMGLVGLQGNSDVGIASVCTMDFRSTGYWSGNSINLSSLLKNGMGLKDTKKFMFARTYNGLCRLYKQQTPGATQGPIISGPPNLLKSFQYTGQASTKYAAYNKDFGNFSQLSIKAFTLGEEILKSQTASKVDDNKVQEWEEKRRNKLLFLMKALSDIEHTIKMGSKDEAQMDGKSFLDKALSQLGFYEDVKTFKKQLDNGGMGLFGDAAALIAGELAKKGEKKNSKTAPIISHSKWDEFDKCFDDDNDIVEAQE